MPKPRVYVETTIPSAYYTDRNDPEMARNRADTQRWWARAPLWCELVSSQAVVDELLRGHSWHVSWRVWLLNGLLFLDPDREVLATAREYIKNKVMPNDLSGDALHLALASHHKCDVLVTWNFRHLANPNKLNHIQKINQRLDLFVPRICTPSDLLEDQP